MGNTRLRPGVPKGTENAAVPAQYQLRGFLSIGEILLRLTGTSTATLDWNDIGIHISHLNGRNMGTISNLGSLQYYVTAVESGFGHGEITNPAGGGAVNALFIITFGVPGHNIPLGVKPGEEILIELDTVPTFTGNWQCKVVEKTGLTPYLIKLMDKTLTFPGDDEIDLPNNVAGFMLTPAATTNPTEITIMQDSTRMDEGSFDELVQEQAHKWNWDGGVNSANLWYWFTGPLWERKRIIEAIQDGVHLSIDGGVGAATLTIVTIRPDYELITESWRQAKEISNIEAHRVKTQPSVQPAMKKVIAPTLLAVEPGSGITESGPQVITPEGFFSNLSMF